MKITDEMVEAAAEALFDSDNGGECTWSDYNAKAGSNANTFRWDARAALEAAFAALSLDEAEAVAFKPCVAHYPDGDYSQMLLEDCVTVTGYPPVLVEPLYSMGDREKIVGFQWHGLKPPSASTGTRDEVLRLRDELETIRSEAAGHKVSTLYIDGVNVALANIEARATAALASTGGDE